MKSGFTLSFFSFVILFACCSFKKDDSVSLSPSNTIIVTTKNYPVGVRFLHNWLGKVYNLQNPNSNKNFTILREYTELRRDGDTSGKIILSIGDNHFNKDENMSDLPPYSFIIKKNGNLVVIKGADDIGTNLGVSYFLDHYCGVKFYLPGNLFTAMPKVRLISLPEKINVEESPFTANITSSGFGVSVDPIHPHDILQWESFWAQMNGLYRNNWGSFQHTMSEIFYDSVIMKNYPEIYPLINGKRYFPSSAKDQNFEPDFASPQLVDASIFAAVKYFKAHPTVDYMAFSVMDGGGYSKEGKMGAFLANYPQTPNGQVQGYTDAYINWLNNLAARLPAALSKNGIKGEKTIAYISYSQVRGIPEKKLNPMILPITVYHLSNGIANGYYAREGAIEKWSKVTSGIGNDDWAEGKGFLYPRIYTSILSGYLKEIKAKKLNFKYAHIEAYPNWALDGPKLYEMSKIYWNPDINIDSLRNLFCRDMFGKASSEMHDYFNTVEQISSWLNNHSATPTHMYNYIGQLSLDNTRMLMVKQARQFLDESMKTNGITNDERKRIDFFSNGFKISEYFFDIYNSKTINPDKINEFKEYLKNTVAGNQMMLNMATEKNFLSVMDNLIDQIVKLKK
ncbi:MAG TPA: DUF4838 domain-containing protein [Hanamia sp.]|nr:DUF4838 domain-containing protein [Hanamia sp.]